MEYGCSEMFHSLFGADLVHERSWICERPSASRRPLLSVLQCFIGNRSQAPGNGTVMSLNLCCWVFIQLYNCFILALIRFVPLNIWQMKGPEDPPTWTPGLLEISLLHHRQPDVFMCFLQSGFVSLGWCLFSPSDTDAQSHHCRQCVAMVTPVLPGLLHPGWFQKVNVAEWFSEVWFFSTHQHLVRVRQPFWCLFPLIDWLSPSTLLLHLLSWQVPGWIGHHCHGDWGNDTHAHKHTVTDSEMRVAGWAARLEEKLSLRRRRQRGLSCHLNETLWKWMNLAPSFCQM